MDINLIAQRTLNAGLCLEILSDPIIFDAISEDGMKASKLTIDVFGEVWIKIMHGDIAIGVAQFKQMFNQCFDTHIHILPEHRNHSKEAGQALWGWILKELPGALIYTNVPVFCKSVKDFLLHFGFKDVGTLEKAWLKNGELNDMTILTKRAI